MLKFDFSNFIIKLQNISPEYILIFNLGLCYILIFILFKFYKETGLYIYISIAIIASNLQVLKAVKFSWYDEPIALGTIMFASIFLASDILNEYYGPKSAKKSIYLSFAAVISLFLLITPALAIKPIDNIEFEHTHFNLAHNALTIIFSPNIYILTASLVAYYFSQITDIYVFNKIRLLTNNHALWLRTSVALIVGCLIDTIIFNLFAWVILSPKPVSFKTLLYSYMISGYLLQILVSFINIPIFYIIKKTIKNNV